MQESNKTADRADETRPANPENGRNRVPVVWAVIGLALTISFTWVLVQRSTAPAVQAVVVYCAQDQVYAEPIFADFEKTTGIKVRAVFDSELVKTVGLANRLLAERERPQCDLFWGNEEMRTRQLAAREVFLETNGWAGFGHRSRRLVINTNLLQPASAPGSLLELTNDTWRGKVSLAYPQFGTTATHFHALRQLWGAEAWEAWCRALAANKPLLMDGNMGVVRRVGKGDAWIGMTDSDDIFAGQREGLPVVGLPLGPEMLLIPNTLGVIRGRPEQPERTEAVQKLFKYLQSTQVTDWLIQAHALEGADTGPTGTLQVEWESLLNELESTSEVLNGVFLR